MSVKPVLEVESLRSLNELLALALALPAEARRAWLDGLPAAQKALAPILATLLERASEDDDRFMRLPIGVSFEDLERVDAPEDQPGDEIGPYRLVRELGSGGMATVWLAERIDGSPRRRVALKLPRIAWAPGLTQRMARERDILATLEHPHIARLYDAGATTAGRPYLAMEYVQGRQIDEYARLRSLPVKARIRLILDIAGAVAHAHARLVVHRDLKPTNILVTDDGHVRLLDFGVAKLLDDDATQDSRLTQFAGRALTPSYASPEQIRGEPLAVASDVYSLAVVSYELLSGRLPYELRRDSAAALEEAILDIEIAPASRMADDPVVARALRGDLDNILAKALRKAPEARYASVGAFADDLTRFLESRPVSARRDSFGYRARRFLQRNLVPVSAAATVLLALFGATAVSLLQGHEVSVQRDRALQRLARNESVSDFLEVMFSQGVPEGQGHVIRDMLQRSESFAREANGRRPEHQAAVLLMLGTQYTFAAEPARAAPLLEQAHALLRTSPDRDLRAQVDCTRALVAAFQGRNEQALALLAPWLEAEDIDHSIAAACLQRRAERARDSFDAVNALRYSRQALDRLGRAATPSAGLEAALQAEYGNALQISGRMVEADQAFERALSGFAATGRGQAADAIVARANWSASKLSSGDVLRGLDLCMEAIRAHEQQGRKPSVALVANCAFAHELLARTDDALRLYGEVIEEVSRGGNVMTQVYALSGQASVWLERGDLARSHQSLDRARQAMASADFPAGHAIGLRYVTIRARYDLAIGAPQVAVRALDGAIAAILERKTRNGALAAAYRVRAAAHLALGDPAAALADAESGRAVAQELQRGRPHSFHTGLGLLAIAEIQREQGRTALAAQAARLALENLQETAGAEHPEALRAARLLAAG